MQDAAVSQDIGSHLFQLPKLHLAHATTEGGDGVMEKKMLSCFKILL
jgi:hypothetical protein